MFMYWSGVTLWLLIGAVVAYVAYLLVEDGVQCARFIWRRHTLLTHGGIKPDLPLYRSYWKLFWAYLFGSYSRPVYCYDRGTGNRAYWPGRDGDEID